MESCRHCVGFLVTSGTCWTPNFERAPQRVPILNCGSARQTVGSVLLKLANIDESIEKVVCSVIVRLECENAGVRYLVRI